jgi:hypothetical protein
MYNEMISICIPKLEDGFLLQVGFADNDQNLMTTIRTCKYE